MEKSRFSSSRIVSRSGRDGKPLPLSFPAGQRRKYLSESGLVAAAKSSKNHRDLVNRAPIYRFPRSRRLGARAQYLQNGRRPNTNRA